MIVAPENACAGEIEMPNSLRRVCKRWVRGKFSREWDAARFGLKFDRGWQDCGADRPLVVFVHGYNSTPDRNDDLIEPLREAKLPCAVLAYPNDQGLLESARLLAKELKAFHQQHPDRRVAIVTHSMGGLIARACIESESLNPGNVRQLIMVAPPTHGTLMAHFTHGMDLWEHCGGGETEGGILTRWRASVVDGLAEAVDDLKPGSHFLTALNALPRNPDVRYSIVLGQTAPMQPSDIEYLRRKVRRGAGLWLIGRKVQRVDEFLADLDEVQQGKGDGIVAVKRGRLAGVNDTVVLKFSHLNVIGPPDEPEVERAHSAVLRRLQPH